MELSMVVVGCRSRCVDPEMIGLVLILVGRGGTLALMTAMGLVLLE